jgi:hypothetical protein
MRLAVHLMLGLALVTGATDARAAALTVWQGAAIVYHVNNASQACGDPENGQVTVGSTYTIVYRPPQGTYHSEAITFNSGRSTALFVATPRFNPTTGTGSFTSTIILSTTVILKSSGTYSNFSISLPGKFPQQYAMITGILSNFFGNPNCTVAFVAALTLRVPPFPQP